MDKIDDRYILWRQLHADTTERNMVGEGDRKPETSVSVSGLERCAQMERRPPEPDGHLSMKMSSRLRMLRAKKNCAPPSREF